MTDSVNQMHQPLTQDDWKFIFDVLEGTKLDVPRIRSEVARLHTMAGAGPDLLDALQTLMRVHDEPAGFVGKYGRALDAAVEAQCIKVGHATEYARAAINKATGAAR